jgi:acetyl-CoA carboxylase carboxyltransferase component
MNLEQKLQEMKRRDQLAQEGGGKERRERQHKEGKMSARERIDFLLDEDTTATASSPDTVASTAGWYSCSRRISLFSADRCRKLMPQRS